MNNIVFIHSAGPQENSQGSSPFILNLKKSLTTEYQLRTPKMPDPENPRYIAWENRLKEEFSKLDGEVILIGHSLGGSVLLKYLSEERCPFNISGLFVLGSPYWGLEEDWQFPEFSLSDDFASRLPDIKQIFLYHSVDDEVVSIAHYEHYIRRLPEADARKLQRYGHLFKEVPPEFLKDIYSL
ncbi:alpha/beta hydrolase [Halobacillus massiliensis]|uniref:alpha/beta hydrolase n=1 Tax=Halobacillus massiliensis TaxID=1926286 RepID=UPI0009E24AB0|nr:alpha/beta hydrolase [Halobacillus massiliensis]